MAQKFHVCDAAEGTLNNPHGLIRVVFRFFGNFECLVFNRQGESVAQDISVGYGIGAEVGVKHDGLLVRHVQRLPQCPAGINWLRGKGGGRAAGLEGRTTMPGHQGVKRLLNNRLDQYEKTGPGGGKKADFRVGLRVGIKLSHLGGDFRGLHQEGFYSGKVKGWGGGKIQGGVVARDVKTASGSSSVRGCFTELERLLKRPVRSKKLETGPDAPMVTGGTVTGAAWARPPTWLSGTGFPIRNRWGKEVNIKMKRLTGRVDKR